MHRVRSAFREDAGSAVAEFAMVGALLTVLTLSVIQLALALHIRNTVLDAAAEGARFAALADSSLSEGAARSRDLISTAIGPGYAADVTATYGRGISGIRRRSSPFVRPCRSSDCSDSTAGWRWPVMLQWRRFRRRWCAEDGTASLEFVTAGMILLLPMVYLVLTMSALQAGSLAVEGAARQAVRVYVQAPDTPAAEGGAERAIRFALADYGLDPSAATVSISCSPRSSDCLRRRATVTITVGVTIGLPLVPPALSIGGPLTIPLRSTATEQVSRFWGAP